MVNFKTVLKIFPALSLVLLTTPVLAQKTIPSEQPVINREINRTVNQNPRPAKPGEFQQKPLILKDVEITFPSGTKITADECELDVNSNRMVCT